jgi:hypothetical protein
MGEVAVVVGGVEVKGRAPMKKVELALGFVGAAAGAGGESEKERREDGDGGEHGEQFDEREAAGGAEAGGRAGHGVISVRI